MFVYAAARAQHLGNDNKTRVIATTHHCLELFCLPFFHFRLLRFHSLKVNVVAIDWLIEGSYVACFICLHYWEQKKSCNGRRDAPYFLARAIVFPAQNRTDLNIFFIISKFKNDPLRICLDSYVDVIFEKGIYLCVIIILMKCREAKWTAARFSS